MIDETHQNKGLPVLDEDWSAPREHLIHRTQTEIVKFPAWHPEHGEKVKQTSGRYKRCRCGNERFYYVEWNREYYCTSCLS